MFKADHDRIAITCLAKQKFDLNNFEHRCYFDIGYVPEGRAGGHNGPARLCLMKILKAHE